MPYKGRNYREKKKLYILEAWREIVATWRFRIVEIFHFDIKGCRPGRDSQLLKPLLLFPRWYHVSHLEILQTSTMFLYNPTYGSGGDVACADPESFVRGGPTLTTFFSFFFFSLIRGGRIQIPLLAGHHRPASETPFKWRFAGGPMMAQH